MKKLILGVLILIGSGAHGSHEVELSEGTLGGTACDAYNTSIRIHNGRLVIDFDDFSARSRYERIARETCLMALPIHIPAGHRVVIKNLALGGSYHLNRGVRGTARAELFFAGGEGDVAEFTAAGGSGFFSEKESGAVARSACGRSGLLRLNASARVVGTGFVLGGAVNVERLTAKLEVVPCP